MGIEKEARYSNRVVISVDNVTVAIDRDDAMDLMVEMDRFFNTKTYEDLEAEVDSLEETVSGLEDRISELESELEDIRFKV